MHPNQRLHRLLSLRAATYCVAVLLAVGLTTGCRSVPDIPVANPNGEIPMNNPLVVPMMDRWIVMDQISNEIDDYFRIYREERIRLVDGIMTEGWIETHPKIGATVLEPWLKDSTQGFEKLHSTLQTVRRFAKVRVIPGGNSYQIDVKVYKELEDLIEPQHSTISARTIRHDSSLDIDREDGLLEPVIETRNRGWIPMGRDFSLEQQILRNIQARLQSASTTGPPQLENCAVDPNAPPSEDIPGIFRHRRR